MENFGAEPEIQMQALAEVGRLVRAAARRGGHNNGVQCEPRCTRYVSLAGAFFQGCWNSLGTADIGCVSYQLEPSIDDTYYFFMFLLF